MKFLIAFLILTCLVQEIKASGSTYSKNFAIAKAKHLLQSMADILSERSTEKIEQYMDEKFVYRGCSSNFDDKSSLDLLESYPTKSRFTYEILDAEIIGNTLIYNVTIQGFGPKFTALYNAVPSNQLLGKYILMKGEEISCTTD